MQKHIAIVILHMNCNSINNMLINKISNQITGHGP